MVSVTGLEFASRPGVVAQEIRERAQQSADVGAAHFPRDAECLDDAVGDGIRKSCLEFVEGLDEPAGHAKIGSERGEGGAAQGGGVYALAVEVESDVVQGGVHHAPFQQPLAYNRPDEPRQVGDDEGGAGHVRVGAAPGRLPVS